MAVGDAVQGKPLRCCCMTHACLQANLPYVVDGDKCVCQTNAVFLYLGDKYNLNGSTPEEKLKNTQLLDEIYDVRNAMIELSYPFKKVRRIFVDWQAEGDV